MKVNKTVIPVITSDKTIDLILFGGKSGLTIILKEDAEENGEAPVQIIEGCFYEYKIEDGYSLRTSEIVSQFNTNKSSGHISPNIYVGTLSIDVLKDNSEQACGYVKIEVQSKKTSYRQDYRYMLKEITEKCTDLLLQHTSPVSQFFTVDFNTDSNTLYQRFAFIKSVLDSVEFNDSVHKVISSPVTRWKETETEKDIRGIRRFNSSSIRQLTNSSNRFDLPKGHPLKGTLNSIPSKLIVNYKTETVDTPENRFVKHALITFQSFCRNFKTKVKDSLRIAAEADLLEEKIEQFLSHSIFREISPPSTLPLNSPVLQRKEGYREILKVWLMFDLAAKMVWKGGDDVYSGNKKDVAVLYEYWLFFKLLEVVEEVFSIDSKSINELITETKNSMEMQIRQGKHFPVDGVYSGDTRKLRILFSYNRPFSGKKDYPEAGSWTKNMRPDYTLSIWPFGISQAEAEKEELIVHIHFDAKYKVENLSDIFGALESNHQSEEEIQTELSKEKEEQKRGTFKREDLLKMHAYKDAIRRTGGAYVLYPGEDSSYKRKGFHELIPGLGAFAIRPTENNDGTGELKKFLQDVVQHFMNRTSQREKMSLKTYETHKDSDANIIREILPEAYGINRNLIPDETFVLVGYYKNEKHLKWIKSNGLYNTRAGDKAGSLKIGPMEASSGFLLLHNKNESESAELFRICETGPKILPRAELEKRGYEKDEKKQDNFYITYKIEPVEFPELTEKKWNIEKILKLSPYSYSALPFAISLSQLLKANTD